MNSIDSSRENSQNEDLLHIVLSNASTINRSSNGSPSNKERTRTQKKQKVK